jgi:hypothetical protein
MASEVDLDNNGEKFSIALDTAGNLEFLANNARVRRMQISDDANEVTFDGRVTVDDGVTIGGSGNFGDLQLKDSDGVNTIFLGSSASEASIAVGGSGGRGLVRVFDEGGLPTIELKGTAGVIAVGTPGQDGRLFVNDQTGTTTISMDGDQAELRLKNTSTSGTTIHLDGLEAEVTVGADGLSGTIEVLDSAGDVTIRLSGDGGVVECDDLDEARLAQSRPVRDALTQVLALQAVSYPAAGANGRGIPRIGLLGADVEAVCPELVSTLDEGRKAVNYSRLTALLVEAIKDQQQLIDRQAAELARVLERVGRVEA